MAMICKKCNAQIAETAKFCSKCGAKVEVVAQVAEAVEDEAEKAVAAAKEAEEKAAAAAKEAEEKAAAAAKKAEEKAAAAAKKAEEKAAKKAAKKSGENKPKKGKGKLVAIIAVAVVFIGLITGGVIFATKTFPIKVTSNVENITTKYNVINEKIEFTSNQKVKDILYAVDPTDPANKDEYKSLTYEEFEGVVEVKLPDIPVKPGKGSIYFIVKGQFQTAKTIEIPYLYTLGFVAEVNVDALKEVGEGIYEIENQLIVKFDDIFTEAKVKDLIKEYEGEIVGALYGDNEYQIKFPAKKLSTVLGVLDAHENVISVYQDMAFLCDADVNPNDSEYASDDWSSNPFGKNWNLELIDAMVAWDLLEGAKTTNVGVIDSVLDTKHEDIKVDAENNILTIQSDKIKSQKDILDLFKKLENTNNSLYSHGTHVAGTIAATANNGIGTAGVNWNNELHFANLWTYAEKDGKVKAYSSLVSFKYCLQYLVYSDCKVVNFSVGGAFDTEASDSDKVVANYINNIFKDLVDNGYDFLFVKAAGNSGKDASVDCWNRYLEMGDVSKAHTIIVGSVMNTPHVGNENVNYNLSPFSNYGELVDVVAPGSDIYSTCPDNKYDSKSGTSMATPHVSGVAALAWSINPSLTSAQVKEMIMTQADLYALRKGTTYPILNAGLVAQAAKNSSTTEVEVPEYGYLVGSVRDIVADKLLENVKVTLTKQDSDEVYIAYTGVDMAVLGLYEVLLTPGTYDISFEKEGYITEKVYDVEITSGTSSYNALLEMVINNDNGEDENIGTIMGTVYNAFNAEGVSGAKLAFRRGTNAKDGDALFAIETDEYGRYEADIEPGVYTVYAEAENYQSDYFTVVVIGGTTNRNQNGSLTPILQEGEMRVVLTWGQTPADVDAHIVGPKGDGSMFQVYYKNKNYFQDNNLVANLDVDDRSSYGPETTTVYNMVEDGVYTYYVFDFTNKSKTNSNAMALSGVVVKLYLPGLEEPKIFNMPSEEGISWKVFSVCNGELIIHNEVDYTNFNQYTNVVTE